MLVVKNPTASAGDIRGTGLVPGLERFPEGGQGNPLQYSSLEDPRTEEPGGLQSMESQSQTQLKPLSMHTNTSKKSMSSHDLMC